MLILHLYYNFEIGGAENISLGILKHDTKYNHIIVVFRSKSSYQSFCEKKYGIKFINLNWSKNGILRLSNWLSLLNLLKTLKPDLIHTNMYDASFYGRVCAYILSIPSVSSFVNQYDRKKIRRGIINSFLSKVTKKIIVCSDDVKNDVIKFDRVKESSISVIPSSIIMDYAPDYSLNIRQKLGIKNTDNVFIYIARLVPQKRVDLLIEAFNNLINVKKHNDIRLILIGDGPLRIKLLELIALKKLYKNIFLLGEIRNLNPYLTEADFYVDSSERAGLSLSIIKALEARLPVLLSDVGGVATLKELELSINTFERNNLLSLIDGIEKIRREHPKKNKKFTKIIKENFSAESMTKKIIDLYDSILIEI